MSYLKPADAAWLNMERPDNLMNINGLLFFKGCPERARLADVLERRLCCFERFRMRVVPQPVGIPRWELDPEFDIDRHLIYEDLPHPTRQEVLKKAGQFMGEPMDRSHPLWEFRVFPGVEDGAVIVVRLHHAIADGIALMRVLLAMCDLEPDGDCEIRDGVDGAERRKASVITWIKSHLSSFLHKSHDLLFHPDEAAEAASLGLKAGLSLKRLVALPPDRETPFRGQLGVEKVAALSEPLELREVKEAARRLGCTINDFLMAALSGGFRRSLLRWEALEEDAEVRVVCPVDLRGGDISDLGNHFGLVFLTLPVGEASAAERLRKVRASMDELKDSAEAIVVFEVLSSLGMIPAELEKPIVEWFGSKASAVVTNLPGPKHKLYLAGAELDSVMYWVPQSGALGLGVSIMSYAGRVRLGVAGDAGLIREPNLIIEDFLAEYQELLSLEAL